MKNRFEVFRQKRSELPHGCLVHRKDDKDYPADAVLGALWGYEPKESHVVHHDLWRFDQTPFNICVFASNVMASSFQEGKRFSVRFAVQLGRKLGMITGNGFSYLRAALDIAVKYGRLPYKFMPDETSGLSWDEYSRYQITDAMLEEAAKWKAPSYHKVRSEAQALQALERDYMLITAGRWYSNMNHPQPEEFYLHPRGFYVGGHAYGLGGHRRHGADFATPQTFGQYYGDKGVAWLQDIFGGNYFDVYFLEKIPGRTNVQRFLEVYDGQCVKGEGATIYLIANEMKQPFKHWEAFASRYSTFYPVRDDVLALIATGDVIS